MDLKILQRKETRIMGFVRFGAPTDLILALKKEFDLRDFVETGTFHGETALWASAHFERVVTIENSPELYASTKPKLGQKPNISFIQGNSKTTLPAVVSKLARPSVFWLDSHWCGGLTHGKKDECPLLEEIHAFQHSELSHFLFIDDARLITSPPPHPHNANQWPPLFDVFEALHSGNHQYYVVIVEDVIIAVPLRAKPWLMNYCQELNTKLLQERLQGQRVSKIMRGITQIPQRVLSRLPARARQK
jgi:hypothetical protein